jgi:hypothetical protein
VDEGGRGAPASALLSFYPQETALASQWPHPRSRESNYAVSSGASLGIARLCVSPSVSRQQHQGALSHDAQTVALQLGQHVAGQVIVGGQLGVIAFAATVPVSVEISDVSYDSTWMASSLSFFMEFSPDGRRGATAWMCVAALLDRHVPGGCSTHRRCSENKRQMSDLIR